jgi:hypothetical protein
VPCRRSQIRLETQIWAKPTDGLKHPQVAGFRFAGPCVAEHIETDVHALNKADDPTALDTADVHENIRATIIGLDEAVSLFGVKELHYSASQLLPPLIENPPPNGRATGYAGTSAACPFGELAPLLRGERSKASNAGN